jgi:hypothetical protein
MDASPCCGANLKSSGAGTRLAKGPRAQFCRVSSVRADSGLRRSATIGARAATARLPEALRGLFRGDAAGSRSRASEPMHAKAVIRGPTKRVVRRGPPRSSTRGPSKVVGQRSWSGQQSSRKGEVGRPTPPRQRDRVQQQKADPEAWYVPHAFTPPNGPGIELPARECTTSHRPDAGESPRVARPARIRRPAAGGPRKPSGGRSAPMPC